MDSSSDVRAVLEKLHLDFVDAFKKNDQAAIGGFYADKAILLPPGRAMLSGRDQIVAFWRRSKRILELAFEITDLEMLSETMVREAGRLKMTMRGQGRDNRTVAAKYISLWSKVGDSWLLNNSVWNGSGGRGQGGQGRGGRAGGRAGGGQGRGQGGGGQGRGQGGGGQGRGQGGGGQGRGQGGGGQGRGQGGGGQGRGQGGGGQGRGQGGGGQGRGQGRGGQGRGQGGGGRGGRGQGQGGGQSDAGGRRGAGNEDSGGLTARSRKLQAIDQAPMVPRIT